MFWFIFSFFVLLFAYLGDENNIISNKHIKLFRVLLIITLSYAVGFGGQPYTDHQSYVNFYNSINYYEIDFSINSIFSFDQRKESFEFGYFILNKIGRFLGLGVPGFLFFIGLIVNSLFVKVFYEFRKPVFVFLIFILSSYFTQQMNLVRQMIAVAVFLYSLRFIVHKKPLYYILLVIVAANFHTSAIVLLAFTPFSFFNINNKAVLIKNVLLSFWLFSLIVSLGLLSFSLLEYIPQLSVYDVYLVSENKIGMTVSTNIVYNFSVLLFFLFYTKNKIPLIYTIIFVFGAIILNFSVDFFNLARFSYYFTPIFCAYIPTMLSSNSIQNIRHKNITTILYYVFIIYYVFSLFNSFIFSDNVLLGSKMYNLSELFIR